MPGAPRCFLDKVRRHVGVRRLRHFVNRNLTLVKYTGMLVAKKGPFCWSSGSRRTNCLWIFLGQKKPNIKYQAGEHLIMPESGVPRIPLNPNPLSEQIEKVLVVTLVCDQLCWTGVGFAATREIRRQAAIPCRWIRGGAEGWFCFRNWLLNKTGLWVTRACAKGGLRQLKTFLGALGNTARSSAPKI